MKNKKSLRRGWNKLCFSLLFSVCWVTTTVQLLAQEPEPRKVTFCIYLLNDTSSLYNEVQSMSSEYASSPVNDSGVEESRIGSESKTSTTEYVVAYVAPKLMYMQNGELKAITVSHGRRSDFYDYEGQMPIELYEEVKVNGSVQTKSAGAFSVPESQGRALVVLRGIKKGEYKELTIAISDKISVGSSMEDSRIFNLTNLNLAIRAGSLTKMLDPNENTKLDPSDFNSNYLPVRLGIRIDDQWRRLYSASLFMAENTPKFFLIYQPRDLEGSLEIVSVVFSDTER